MVNEANHRTAPKTARDVGMLSVKVSKPVFFGHPKRASLSTALALALEVDKNAIFHPARSSCADLESREGEKRKARHVAGVQFFCVGGGGQGRRGAGGRRNSWFCMFSFLKRIWCCVFSGDLSKFGWLLGGSIGYART